MTSILGHAWTPVFMDWECGTYTKFTVLKVSQAPGPQDDYLSLTTDSTLGHTLPGDLNQHVWTHLLICHHLKHFHKCILSKIYKIRYKVT